MYKRQIYTLTNQITKTHFNNIPEEIQIDCDWTESTQHKYFELISKIKTYYKSVSTTIRLHQIKYQARTGIPPSDKGVLMLYNIGNLKNMNQNSILDSKVVAKYINKNTNYPLALELALPLFSQTVIKNNHDNIKLVKGIDKQALANDTYFSRVSNNMLNVKKDTLYHGFYLMEGFQLKLERVSEEQVISSYNIIKSSQLSLSKTIFYHLDDQSLESIDYKKIIKQL